MTTTASRRRQTQVRLAIGMALMGLVTFGQFAVYLTLGIGAYIDGNIGQSACWVIGGMIVTLITSNLAAWPIAWLTTLGFPRASTEDETTDPQDDEPKDDHE